MALCWLVKVYFSKNCKYIAIHETLQTILMQDFFLVTSFGVLFKLSSDLEKQVTKTGTKAYG